MMAAGWSAGEENQNQGGGCLVCLFLERRKEMGLRCGGQKIPSRGCCSYFVSPSGEEPDGMKAAEGRGSC